MWFSYLERYRGENMINIILNSKCETGENKEHNR